jgi:tetrahydromethanopterin S-methyltransferase subunit F
MAWSLLFLTNSVLKPGCALAESAGVRAETVAGAEATMVDTARAKYPPDMIRVADFPDMGSIENMANDVVDRVKHFAREQPITFGLWALGIGFVLGWKLKPW